MKRAKNAPPVTGRVAPPKTVRSSSPVNRPANSSDRNIRGSATATPPRAETTKTEPPPDPKVVYRELIPVLRRTIEARIRGDRVAFNELLADDFSQTDGLRRRNKARYLAELAASKDVLLHVIEKADLSFDAGGNPVLTSVVRYKSVNSQIARFENVFTYVKRDGRWQIISWQSRSLSPYDGISADPSLASTDELLYEARMDLINKQYNSVITIVQLILNSDPANAEANLLLGKGYFFCG